MLFGRITIMNDGETSPNIRAPAQDMIGIASFACLAALTFFYWYAGPAVQTLDVWWARWLVYVLIPILIPFIILYRSAWHRELAGLARTGSLLLAACVILVGVYLVVGAMLAVGTYSLSSLEPHVAGR